MKRTRKRSKEAVRDKQTHDDYFLGFSSSSMLQLEELINHVAPLDEPILITGEPGTEKGILARLIHDRSSRAGKVFETVHCSIGEDRLENELFGKAIDVGKKASRMTQGKLELADRGTLFLDEIGNASLPVQVKLLRLLQEGVIKNDGIGSEILANTRIIASTGHALEKATQTGKFLEELYFRLSVLHCEIPPLRDRTEDIPILIHRFLHEEATRLSLPVVPSIPEDVTRVLLSSSWRGNFHELLSVIRRLAVLSRNRLVSFDDLPLSVQFSNQNRSNAAQLGTLEEMERQHIMNVLSVESNQEKAAEMLGITTVTLWKKRKAYGLP